MENKSSEYIEEQRLRYSQYLLQHRALPSIMDGLKAAGRRVLWCAKDMKKYKSATLGGMCMPLHPHASPETTINTLTGPYTNNIPLLDGVGAFGTLLNPTGYGASRYTSVSVSKFTHDVIFKDIEIIPLKDNYDGTLLEPLHFLPLIPIVLLNPTEGIAIGFACNILSRSLDDIIKSQIKYLQQQPIKDSSPVFKNHRSIGKDTSGKWLFVGEFERKNSSIVTVTLIPYGISFTKYINILNKLIEDNVIVDYIDKSGATICIDVIHKRGVLNTLDDDMIRERLLLVNAISENMNMVNLDSKTVLSTNFIETIEIFTNWRLKWYVARYERLVTMITMDIQKYLDVLTAIKYNIGGIANTMHSRAELKEFLSEIDIKNIDYIADLPVYRFTENEKKKVEEALANANAILLGYNELLADESKRRKVYIVELKEVLRKYGKKVT